VDVRRERALRQLLDDLDGRLDEALVGRVAQDAVAGPVRELDVHDELRLDEDRATWRLGPGAERRGLAALRLQQLHQLVEVALLQPAARTSRVAQTITLV